MAIEAISRAVTAVPTRLPTIRRQQENINVFSEVLVTSWPSNPGGPSARTYKQRLSVTAWAYLLHSYTSNDVVIFEVFGGKDLENEMIETCVGSQIAICTQTKPTRRCNGSSNSYVPSIEMHARTQLLVCNDIFNTGVSFTDTNLAIPENLDFLLTVSEQDNFDTVRLHSRDASVPKKFAACLSAVLESTLIDFTQDNVLRLEKPIMSEYDYTQLRKFTQAPLTEHPDCMHSLVAKRVRVNPTSQAVCSWDGNLSYAELDVYSNAIARTLVASGIEIGAYVPFVFEKSMWSVVAVLAILKAGAAFVPIDPSQPTARIQCILADVNAQMILVSSSLEEIFRPLVKEVLVVSAATVKPETERCLNSDLDQKLPIVGPQNTAFVLFTSGSTGKPKGMIMQHGAYSTHTLCHGRAMGYQGARVLQFAAHTFDVYVMDVFATLVFGGCVCIPSEEDRKLNITRVFNDFEIDLAILTPSFAHVLDPTTLPTLKCLAVGGEALKRETVQKWTTRARGVSLMQIYGPAEVGICILGDLSHSRSSPETIGYPLDNSLCLLIDPDNTDRLVPLGATGELVVAGPTMLREYLNNVEKTRACFLDNPIWAEVLDLPYRRFYRSGDLLKYNIERMDGSFDFVGRLDSQVKYHGQRMELEDIEHHLSSIPSVSACMVSVPKEGVLQGRLVAVVQLESADQTHVKSGKTIRLLTDAELSIGRIREHLSERLPGYMIPNALLVVQDIPFTPSLKLDRPTVNRWVARLDQEIVSDDLIRQLSCDILNTDEVTAHLLSREYARLVGGGNQKHQAIFEGYDFSLQAGGIDSIQIISLSHHIQNMWKVNVPMSLMLSSSATIRSIAGFINARETCQPSSALESTPDIKLEAQMLLGDLTKDVRRNHKRPAIRNVLLTGATGFLGIEILRMLLQQRLRVCALVRGKTEAAARQRLIDQAKAAGWWKETFAPQVEVWLGNLSQPNLGLNDVHLRQIVGNNNDAVNSVHAIVHNGARVHYGLDYASLKSTNVVSTWDLLRLSATPSCSIQSFVYVSGGEQLTFAEAAETCNVPKELGYTRSKLVSESLVKECMMRPEFADVQLSVVKPGYIVGATPDGVSNLTDFLWRLVATCVEIGSYNADDADRWICVADKTRVAELIVNSSLLQTSKPVTKVLDGLRFTELWNILSHEFSFEIVPLPYEQWLHHVRTAVAAKQATHVMFPLLHMLEAGESIGTLAGPSEASPGVKDAMRANIRYLIQVGYLRSYNNHRTNRNVTPDEVSDVVQSTEVCIAHPR